MEKLKDNHKKVVNTLWSEDSGIRYSGDNLTPDKPHRKSTAEKKTKSKGPKK